MKSWSITQARANISDVFDASCSNWSNPLEVIPRDAIGL